MSRAQPLFPGLARHGSRSVLGGAIVSVGLWLSLAIASVPAAPAPASLSARDLPAAAREALVPRTARLAADGSPALLRARLAGQGAPDSLRAVVLLCDFADSLLYGRYGQVPGSFPPPRQSEFYYAAHDSLFFAHQFADVAEYFAAASGGRFALRCDIVARPANLPRPMAWYGNHPARGEQSVLLAHDVVAALDPHVDFSRYDTVVLVHAGAGEETDLLGDSPAQIYSTYLSPEDFARAAADTVLPQPHLTTGDVDGEGHPVLIDQVLVLPETEFQDPLPGFGGFFGSLGVYCFEVALRLGMLSLSDFTPEGNPDSQGVGEFDLMGYGLFVGVGYIPCQPAAFNKLLMGWVEPYRVEPAAGNTHRLDPIETAKGDSLAARVEIGGREYWLLEYRLQDPDGNRIFSFAGDLNGNNIPDFYDADSANGDGTPTGFFDPATDTREWLTGAEWDFFMSENSARLPGVKGAGSGLYVWHVDEGLIEDLIDAPENLFEADPRHKAVDLEEADGIQDLDSRQSSAFILGGDFDSYRGEDNATFGPDTTPDTRSAGGALTGVTIDGISNVVADSNAVVGDPPRARIRYADHLTFRCRREDRAGGPSLAAEHVLDGVDLSGSHLLAVDLDAAPDGRIEIVAGGHRGEVYAFEPDLTEQCDGDHDPATIGVLAVGTDADGQPVPWNGPAAAGDIDGDGRPEVILTAPRGLYAFNGEDGSEVADGDGNAVSHGLLAPLEDCALPPLLMSFSAMNDEHQHYAPGERVIALAVERRGEPPASWLRFIGGDGFDTEPAVALGQVVVSSLPLAAQNLIHVAAADTAAGTGTVIEIAWGGSSPQPTEARRRPLPLCPGAWPLVFATRADELAVIAGDGSALLLADTAHDWPPEIRVHSPLSGVATYVGNGLLGAVNARGFFATGWPVRPRPAFEVAPVDRAPCPLLAKMTGGDRNLFQSRDGRLYLYDGRGALQPGWPLAGPSETTGTPLLLDLDGDGNLDLCAAGTFTRIEGRDAEGGQLVTTPVSRLAVWTGIGSGTAVWPMWQANPWRAPEAAPRMDEIPSPPPAGLVEPGSLLCYPMPLRTGILHVRASFRQACTARAVLHDLSGQEVVAAEPVAVPGGIYELRLPMDGVASGLYLCRLVAERAGSRTETTVVPVAVAR